MICLDCHQTHISWRVALNVNRRDIGCAQFNRFRVSAMQQETMQIALNNTYSPHILSLERVWFIFLDFEISSTPISDCLVSTDLFAITSSSLIASAFLSRVGNKQASQAERPQLAGLQFLTPRACLLGLFGLNRSACLLAWPLN